MKDKKQKQLPDEQLTIVKLGREDKRVAKRLTEFKQLRYVSSLINGFDRWWPSYSSCRSELKKEEVLESLWKYKAKLLKKQRKHSEASESSMRARSKPPPPHPNPPPDEPQVERVFTGYTLKEEEKTSGVAHASGGWLYPWVEPERPDDTKCLIHYNWAWHAKNTPIADSLRFISFFSTEGGFPMSLSDSVAKGAVLQVDFPAVSFDAVLHYYTKAVIGIPTGVTVIDDWGFWDDKDWGIFDIDFVVRGQSKTPEAPNFWYYWYPGVRYDKTTDGYIWTKLPIEGEMVVKKNTQSSVYLGITIQMMGADCYVCSGASNSSPDEGYFDFRTPDWADTDSFNGVYYEFRREFVGGTQLLPV